jgi:HlyD family secretion protein
MHKILKKLGHSFKNHKIIWSISVIIIIVILYFVFRADKNTVTQYVVGIAEKGTLIENVTGSGQVYSENQTDIKSEVSGTITSIPVSIGQNIKRGQIIATIDSREAYLNLENARIALAKITDPAKPRDINDAENNLNTAYTDAFNAMSNTFLDMPTIMIGLKELLYNRDTYLSDQNINTFSDTAREYRNVTGISFDKANNHYNNLLQQYKSLNRLSSTSSIDKIINETLLLAKETSEALKNAQNTITFISVNYPDYSPTTASTAATNVVTWSTSINTNLGAISKAIASIDSSNNSLLNLEEGADSLDIRSQKLAVEQAEYNYSKYFIVAPFDGVVGRIPVNVHDTITSGTIVSTIISNKKFTNIPLNEVDAVKVSSGQKAKLTFDAIDNLTISGSVLSVDQVGTANQGVITYNVKINFDEEEPRIKAGMSVDADIITNEKTDILIVPSNAIKNQGRLEIINTIQDDTLLDQIKSQTNKNKTITVPSSKYTPTQKEIVAGINNDTSTEIKSGIEEGELIVVRTITGVSKDSQTPTIFSGFRNSQQNLLKKSNSSKNGTQTK